MGPTRRPPHRRLVWAAVLLAAVGVLSGASPSPTDVLGPGDPRSEGEGAGLVGAPVVVAAGVVLVGLLAAAGTLVYVRLSRDD